MRMIIECECCWPTSEITDPALFGAVATAAITGVRYWCDQYEILEGSIVLGVAGSDEPVEIDFDEVAEAMRLIIDRGGENLASVSAVRLALLHGDASQI